MAGSVLGHEHQIMHYLQQFVQHNVNLDILSEGSHEAAAATVLIHRMKPRLPSDEIQALLASVHGIQASVMPAVGLRLRNLPALSCMMHANA